MLQVTNDFKAVLACVFQTGWRLFTSFNIPGTNITIPGMVFAIAMIVFVIKAVFPILGLFYPVGLDDNRGYHIRDIHGKGGSE